MYESIRLNTWLLKSIRLQTHTVSRKSKSPLTVRVEGSAVVIVESLVLQVSGLKHHSVPYGLCQLGVTLVRATISGALEEFTGDVLMFHGHRGI